MGIRGISSPELRVRAQELGLDGFSNLGSVLRPFTLQPVDILPYTVSSFIPNISILILYIFL